MKITAYELFKVPPRWLFLKIVTDEGIIGWGEPVLEGKADTVSAAVRELMNTLIGKIRWILKTLEYDVSR